MDNNNLYGNENQNGEPVQLQKQPEQPQQQTYQQEQFQQQAYQQQPYQNFQQQTYQQPYQQPYQQQYQNVYPTDGELEEPVSFGEWMLTTLILCIPCVNIIMMFVWAFGSSTKKSKSNYFKAMLAWALISIVLSIVIMIVFGASFAALYNSGM